MTDMISRAAALAALDSEEGLYGGTIEYRNGVLAALFHAKEAIAALPAVTPTPDLETCGRCMGSGYGGHPDSGALCAECNGSGGVAAIPSPDPVTNEACRQPTLAEALKVPEIAAMVKAAKCLQSDMLERAQIGLDRISGDQYRVVNAGNGAWMGFTAALRNLEGGE